jgi:hypothetical protein
MMCLPRMSSHSAVGSMHLRSMTSGAGLSAAIVAAACSILRLDFPLLQVDAATAVSLLVACNYDVDAAIEFGLQGVGPASAAVRAGIQGQDGQSGQQPSTDILPGHAAQTDGGAAADLGAGSSSSRAEPLGSGLESFTSSLHGTASTCAAAGAAPPPRCMVCFDDRVSMTVQLPCRHPTCDSW